MATLQPENDGSFLVWKFGIRTWVDILKEASNIHDYDCIKCADNLAIENYGTDDGVDNAAKPNRRRLMDGSSKKNGENLIEDFWWDLSIADVYGYGTPGGFNSDDSRASLGAMAKIHDNI